MSATSLVSQHLSPLDALLAELHGGVVAPRPLPVHCAPVHSVVIEVGPHAAHLQPKSAVVEQFEELALQQSCDAAVLALFPWPPLRPSPSSLPGHGDADKDSAPANAPAAIVVTAPPAAKECAWWAAPEQALRNIEFVESATVAEDKAESVFTAATSTDMDAEWTSLKRDGSFSSTSSSATIKASSSSSSSSSASVTSATTIVPVSSASSTSESSPVWRGTRRKPSGPPSARAAASKTGPSFVHDGAAARMALPAAAVQCGWDLGYDMSTLTGLPDQQLTEIHAKGWYARQPLSETFDPVVVKYAELSGGNCENLASLGREQLLEHLIQLVAEGKSMSVPKPEDEVQEMDKKHLKRARAALRRRAKLGAAAQKEAAAMEKAKGVAYKASIAARKVQATKRKAAALEQQRMTHASVVQKVTKPFRALKSFFTKPNNSADVLFGATVVPSRDRFTGFLQRVQALDESSDVRLYACSPALSHGSASSLASSDGPCTPTPYSQSLIGPDPFRRREPFVIERCVSDGRLPEEMLTAVSFKRRNISTPMSISRTTSSY